AVLRAKLAHLDAWSDRRRTLAAHYSSGLADSSLTLPYAPEWTDPVWHLYVVRSSSRETLQARLSEAGIGSLIHYPIPPHMQSAYADLAIAPDALPLARQLAGEVLSLPMGPHLTTEEVDFVCQTIRELA